MVYDRAQLLDSLTLFDRPDRERLRNFLPRSTDVDQLVADLFRPFEEPAERAGR